ncbi:MAG: protein kinase [Planctomycetota bacterium]
MIARRSDDGRPVCEKRYESGSAADADREFAMGRLAGGEGVVRHLERRLDQESGRPSVLLELVDGLDLEAVLRREGALDVRSTAAIGHAVATVLGRLAALRAPGAPQGMVHGDVKPSNILLRGGDLVAPSVVLVDFEHAHALGEGAGHGFTGGTHGYAAPETYDGAPAGEAADVFSLGAVLCLLCTGSPPFRAEPADAALDVHRGLPARWRFAGLDPRLMACIEQCLSPSPGSRPDFARLAQELRAIAESRDATRTARDRAQLHALSGDATALEAAFAGDPRTRSRLARRARIAREAHFELPPHDAPLDAVLQTLPLAARRIHTALRIAPRAASAQTARAQCEKLMRRVLTDLPPEVQRLRRAAEPDTALELCEAAVRAAQTCGRLPIEGRVRAIGTATRAPATFLARLCRDVRVAAQAHRRILERIRDGEASGEVDAIDGAIGELSAMYGGSSPAVAAARDRRHRFEFYLTRLRRLACAREAIDALGEELGLELELEALDTLGRDDGSDDTAHTPRALLRGLEDVAKEFPATAPRLAPARRAVHTALTRVTEEAWSMIVAAETKLATPPIPIRPLTDLLDRLDRLRQADAFVDVTAGTRADLTDAIESIRLKLEQARAERDRLTRGAREALDRGHLTTAIFDMERAVGRFGDSVDEADAGGLAGEYEAAKLRKREVEESLERSHELAARYGDLLAQPGSTPKERLAALREREHVLTFLSTSLGPDRGEPYAQDLRDVRVEILRETAADGERKLASARHDSERRAVAQATLDALLHALPESATDAESTEVRALIQVWSDRGEAAAEAVRNQRQRMARRGPMALRLAIGAALITAAVLLAVQWGRGGQRIEILLHTALGEATRLVTRPDGTTSFDSARAVTALREFAHTLAAQHVEGLAEEADRVASAVDEVAAGRAGYASVRTATIAFLAAVTETERQELAMPAREFTQRALRAAFATAVIRREDPQLAATLREDETLQRSLSVEDANLLDRLLAR